MVDIYTRSKRSHLMSCVKNKRTDAEQKVADILNEIGVAYQRNARLKYGTPDFVLQYFRIIINVHGCFWHGHKNCSRARLPKSNAVFWKNKIEKNCLRDKRIARQFRKDGWSVLTIWRCKLSNTKYLRGYLKRYLNRGGSGASG